VCVAVCVAVSLYMNSPPSSNHCPIIYMCHGLYHRHVSRTLFPVYWVCKQCTIANAPLLYHLHITNSTTFVSHELDHICISRTLPSTCLNVYHIYNYTIDMYHELYHRHVSRTLSSTCLTNAIIDISHELYRLMLLCYLISYVNIVNTPLLYHLHVTNSMIDMTHELY